MSDLYDTDTLTWSERQAELLRRVAAGERVAANDLDWGNIIDEIESVGRSELQAVRSLLTQALRHDLKAEAWPLSREVPYRRAEARAFRAQARGYFTESMRQRINLARVYRDALVGLPETIDAQPPLPLPAECPVTLDELLAEPVL